MRGPADGWRALDVVRAAVIGVMGIPDEGLWEGLWEGLGGGAGERTGRKLEECLTRPDRPSMTVCWLTLRNRLSIAKVLELNEVSRTREWMVELEG